MASWLKLPRPVDSTPVPSLLRTAVVCSTARAPGTLKSSPRLEAKVAERVGLAVPRLRLVSPGARLAIGR